MSKSKFRNNNLIIKPLRMIALITIFAGITALIFEVNYFAEFSIGLYFSRLIATTIGFIILAATFTYYGSKYSILFIHILLLSIMLSFGSIIYLIPKTLLINSHLLALTIFTTALFLSWDTKNQIIVAIYYNIIFATSILYNNNSIYSLPNVFANVIFVLIMSVLSVGATTINSRLREKLLCKSLQAKEILDNSIEGIFRITESGVLVSANNAFYSILKELDFTLSDKMNFTDGLLVENSLDSILSEVNEHGFVKDHIKEIKLTDGSKMFFSLNLRPSIVIKKSSVKHYDGSILNVTERILSENKQIETLLKLHDAKLIQEKNSLEALELKDSKIQLLAKINHELKTPINSISLILDMLTTDCIKTDEELKEYALSAKTSIDALLDTLDKYLDFTKIEAGKLELEVELFNFKGKVDECLSLLTPLAELKNISLSARINNDIPNLIMGDGDHYKQIVINLANNALKFTDSGEVTILIKKGETVGDDFEIITEVSDTGRGIPEDKISTLFMPYQQVNSKNDRKYGSGLGLIICKELVKLLGGNIRVQSEVEMGSVFTFNSIFQKFENTESVPDNLTFQEN